MARAKSNRSDRVGQHTNRVKALETAVNEQHRIGEPANTRELSPSESIKSQNLEMLNGSTLDTEPEETLATQFPVHLTPRPPSVESIKSQEASIQEPSLSPFNSQQDLSTQAPPRQSKTLLPDMSTLKPAILNVSNKGKELLQCLQAGYNGGIREETRNVQTRDPNEKRGFAIPALLNSEDDPVAPNDLANDKIIKKASSASTPTVPQQTALIQPSSHLSLHNVSPSAHQTEFRAEPENGNPSADCTITSIRRTTDNRPISKSMDAKVITIQRADPLAKYDRAHPDPWAGMRKITRKDVKIPNDQESLFDNPDSWIPADVGRPTPHCHVPPGLLHEWNARVARKEAAIVSPNSSQQEVAESPSLSQNVWQSEEECESDFESAISWCPSPPDHLRRLAVPPDSSPLGQSKVFVAAGYHKYDRSENIDTDTTELSGNDNFHRKGRDPHSPQKILEVNGVQEMDNNEEDGRVENQVSSSGDASIERNDTSKDGYTIVDDDNDGRMSDDSDMEISIPHALDASLQKNIASQVEANELGGSDLSNSNAAPPMDKVQIQNTPSIGVDVLQPSTAPQSTDEPKSSSQLIVNSVDSKGKRFIDVGGSNSENGSQVVDSQNNNSDEHHSSIPSHQDSQCGLEVVHSSSLFSIGLQTQDYVEMESTRNETTQSESVDSAVVTPAISMKRKADHLDVHDDDSPSKRAVKRCISVLDSGGTQDTRRKTVTKVEPKILHDKHRHIFAVTPEGAPMVFQSFKLAYPAYPGDLSHFKGLCRKLQHLRHGEPLRNHAFWDDFIIRHIRNYGPYVQECVSAGRHWDDYTDYFCSHFVTRPFFKKRRLVPHTLDTVMLESDIRLPDAPLMVDMETQVDMDRVTSARLASDKPHLVDVAVQVCLKSWEKVETNLGTTSESGNSIHRAQPRQSSGTRGAHRTTLSKTQLTNLNFRDSPKSRLSADLNSETRGLETPTLGVDPPKGNDGRRSHRATLTLIKKIQKEDRHALRTLITKQPHPQNPTDELRHDSDTPFKLWACADQNVVSERRRRGGSEIPRDENGNIQIEEHSRIGWENGRQTRGWAWQPTGGYS